MKYSKSLRLGSSIAMSMLVCGMVLASCGESSTTTTTGGNASSCGNPPKLTKKDHYKIGFSQTESNGPWRIAETKSIKDEASKRGDTLVYTDAAGDTAKQVQDVKDMVTQKVDVIILAPREEKALVPAVLAAKAACIPVFLVDRDVDHSLAKPNQDYITFIGSDFIKQGQRAAQWLVDNAGGAGKATAKVIELEGSTGASAAIQRKKGFDDAIGAEKGITLLASQSGDFARDKGRATMETLLQAHPDVTAVYAHNDEMALGAIAALKAAGKQPGKDVLIVSIDGEGDGLHAIINGELGTSVQSSPFFGPIAFQTIDSYASGTKLDDWIVVQDKQYTKDNAQQNLDSAY